MNLLKNIINMADVVADESSELFANFSYFEKLEEPKSDNLAKILTERNHKFDILLRRIQAVTELVAAVGTEEQKFGGWFSAPLGKESADVISNIIDTLVSQRENIETAKLVNTLALTALEMAAPSKIDDAKTPYYEHLADSAVDHDNDIPF